MGNKSGGYTSGTPVEGYVKTGMRYLRNMRKIVTIRTMKLGGALD